MGTQKKSRETYGESMSILNKDPFPYSEWEVWGIHLSKGNIRETIVTKDSSRGSGMNMDLEGRRRCFGGSILWILFTGKYVFFSLPTFSGFLEENP